MDAARHEAVQIYLTRRHRGAVDPDQRPARSATKPDAGDATAAPHSHYTRYALQKLTEQTRILVIDLLPRYEIAAARFFFEPFIVAGESPGVTHPAGMNDNGRQVLCYRF